MADFLKLYQDTLVPEYIYSVSHIFFYFGEKGREGERERNIDVRKKHQLVAFCTFPDRGLNLQPQDVP